MHRALAHPRLFTRGVGNVYTRRGTILTSTETTSDTGMVIDTWGPLQGHEDMPCAISALNDFQRATYTGSDTRIMLQGYHPEVTTKMMFRDDEGRTYEINSVSHAYGMATRLACSTASPGGPD